MVNAGNQICANSLHGIISRFGADLRGALDNASELCGLAPRVPQAADGSQQQFSTRATSATLQARAEGESGAATGGGTSGSTALVDQAELDSSPLLTDPAAVARREQLLSRLASSTPQLPTSPLIDRELADAEERATASPPLSAASSDRPLLAPGEQMVHVVNRQVVPPLFDEPVGVRARRAAPFETYVASRARSSSELEQVRLPANLGSYADPTFTAAAPPINPDRCRLTLYSC